jgi:hypothetical protein
MHTPCHQQVLPLDPSFLFQGRRSFITPQKR